MSPSRPRIYMYIYIYIYISIYILYTCIERVREIEKERDRNMGLEDADIADKPILTVVYAPDCLTAPPDCLM